MRFRKELEELDEERRKQRIREERAGKQEDAMDVDVDVDSKNMKGAKANASGKQDKENQTGLSLHAKRLELEVLKKLNQALKTLQYAGHRSGEEERGGG